MLQLIVRAHLTLDHDSRADEVINLFFNVVARVEEACRRDPGSPASLISCAPAAIELERELSIAWKWNTGPELGIGLLTFEERICTL